MNIGFDLDRVLVDRSPLLPENIADRVNKYKNNGTLTYRIPSKPEQFLRRLSHYSLLRPAIKSNLDFIQQLAKKNNSKQYLISGRFDFLEKATLSLVKKQRFDTIFDAMFFNFHNEQPHLFKEKIIKTLKLDKYIDDDLDLLEYLAKRNTTTQFFWFNNHVYSRLEKNLLAIPDLKYIL